MTRQLLLAIAATAIVTVATATPARAATVAFSSIEVGLADADDYNAMSIALWTGWLTQLYEYNMPFIELANTDENAVAIEQLVLTIGDTDYNFSNEFLNKDWTNSYPYQADGTYAITGFSTPDIDFTSEIADNGDVLIVNFGNGGLQPGEVVRFQVDIDPDEDVDGAMPFADFTQVFFNNDDGDTVVPNMELTLVYADVDGQVVPNGVGTVSDFDTSIDVQTPRPYTTMQTIDVFPETTFDPIPEPAAAGMLLAAIGMSIGTRRS